MNAVLIGRYLLQLRLMLGRVGAAKGIVCLLWLAGLMAWQWGLPQWQARLQSQRRALTTARQALLALDAPTPALPRPLGQQRLDAFYDTLGEAKYVEQQIKTLFALAAKSNLKLSSADYKLSIDRNGRYRAYQVVIPVKGPYRAIRQFCEQTLLTIPFASLDEIGFRRDTIANQTLEARLRWTLYLNDAPSAGSTAVVAARETE